MIGVARRRTVKLRSAGIAMLFAATCACATAVELDIPIGPADENTETSRAVTAILNQCVTTYENLDALHAAGQYLSVSKSDDSPTTYAEAHVTIDYKSPDRLAAHVRSQATELPCAFVADGTTVTQLWINSYFKETEKKYLQLPQPDTLGAFVDRRRAGGELLDDESGTLAVTAIADMVISNDVHQILFANIDRFVYEGSEQVSGHRCHQIRFIQSNPDVNVILWIDVASSLIRKTSFIYSYDENYDLVDSFEEGTSAEMMVMTWDELTTDPGKIDESAFSVEIPPDYEQYNPKAGGVTYTPKKSFWEALVSGAAAASAETTWTLTRQHGSIDITAGNFLEVPADLITMGDYQFLKSTSRSLLIATPDGKIRRYNATGKLLSTTDLEQDISQFDCLETTDGQVMQLLALPKDSGELIAWDLEGEQLWTYSHPLGKISSFETGKKEASVYVGVNNGNGFRKLDSDGRIEYAYGNGWVYSIFPSPPAIDRVMCVSIAKLDYYDGRLNPLDSFVSYPDIEGVSLLWDTENPAAPVIALVDTPGGDVLLQRRTLSGEVQWTTMIEPELEDALDYDVNWLKIPVNGQLQRCISCVLNTGDIVIADENGKVLYRGQFDVDAASVNRSDGETISYSCVADLNNDGIHEIYLQADKSLVRLSFR